MIGDTLQQFFGDEWARFISGVERLNPQDWRNIRDAFARQRLPEAYHNIISTPGWQDIIRWPHGPALTRADFGEYLAAQRQGREPNLTPEIAAAVAAAIDQRNRMLGAPDAEMAGSFGRIFNAIDNVQDLMVTVGLLGHLALWAAPTVFGRFLPVVGTILLVSDLLNILNVIGMAASPMYALACNGPAAALAAGIPALIMGPGLQGKAWRAAFTAPRSHVGMLRGVPAAFTKRGLVGLLSQGFQVTTSLWGYGLSLGALVGMLTQTAAGAVLTAKGDVVHWPSGSDGERLQRLINRPLVEDNPADLVVLHQAATILACAPAVLARPDAFTPAEYTQTLMMHAVAQQTVYTRLAGYAWQPIVGDMLEHEISTYAVPSHAAAPLFTDVGIRPGDRLPHDLPGHPLEALGADVVLHDAPAVTAGVERFCAQQRTTPWGTLAGELVNAGVDHAWEHLSGEERPIKWTFTPDWALITSLTEVWRLPVTSADPQRLWSFWQAARAAHEAKRAGKWTAATWEALAARHGVPLLRLLPPDAPWPTEWHDWAREQKTGAP